MRYHEEMTGNLTQQLLPFTETTESLTLPPAPYQPSDEALAAFERLEDWLLEPHSRRPTTELAEETLRALARALLEGKLGWFHAAEDNLEVLKLRNGKTEGDDMPADSKVDEGMCFHRAVDDVLDCLHEVMFSRWHDRPGP